jgi:hypothetical protein
MRDIIRLLQLPKPSVKVATEEAAVSIAQQYACERGWLWLQPIEAIERIAWRGHIMRWEISSNVNGKDANCHIVVDAVTGEITEARFASLFGGRS